MDDGWLWIGSLIPTKQQEVLKKVMVAVMVAVMEIEMGEPWRRDWNIGNLLTGNPLT